MTECDQVDGLFLHIEFARENLSCPDCHSLRVGSPSLTSRDVRFSALNGLKKFGRHFALIFEPLLQPLMNLLGLTYEESGDCVFDFTDSAHARQQSEVVSVRQIRNRLLNEPSDSGIMGTMQTLTIEEIHADPYRIDRSIDAGEPIEVFRNGKRVARLLPDAPEKTEVPIQWPDIRLRVKAIFGDRVVSNAEAEDMRAYENGELSE